MPLGYMFYIREKPAFGVVSLVISGERRLRRCLWSFFGARSYRQYSPRPLFGAGAYTALGGDKKNWGAWGAPNGFKILTLAMRILNMCMVLKLDNGKVVSIANEQNHRAMQYRISV